MNVSPPNSACFPGTRLKVTKKICSWMDSSLFFTNPHIMWVYGYAGCGKSAIAQAIARHFAGENRLAASFFFFRGAGDRSTIVRFATTVASQVAAAIPATAPIIETVVKTNPALLTTTSTSLSDQFEHLVYRPINTVKWDKLAAFLRRGPFLIVLDGVDECEDREEVAVFIDRMIEFFDRKPRTPLRFLITSRVKNHIHQRLHSSKQVRLLDLVKHTSNEDILSALEAAIAKERHGRLLACDETWPSPEDKVRLVKHIGGSYIFMTTILKSLFNPSSADGLTPMERLPVVLGMSPDFDSLYKAILEPWKHLPHFQGIISTIALAIEPLSVAQIANILDIGTTTVVNSLIKLHAIMQIPGDDHTPVTLWHTSLRDFLCSEDRAGTFLVHHKHIARGCLTVSAAAAGGLPESPAAQYSTRFADRHWVRFLESMDDDMGAFNRELGNIVVSLQKAFSDLTITKFHFCVFDKLLHHLEGVASGIAKAEGASSGTSPLSSLTLTQDVKWRALRMVIHPEEWQAFCSAQTALSLMEVPEDRPHWVRLLLERGSDSDLSSHLQAGLQCLHAACSMGREDILQLLLQYGVDPNSKDQSGKTPLCIACENDQAQCAKLLLDHGANTTEDDVPSLRRWANQLYHRTVKVESSAEMGAVVRLYRELLRHCPPGHADRAAALRSLAMSLRSRSEMTASTADLDEAVQLGREALELCPPGHADRAAALRSLAISLQLRSQMTDVDETMQLCREALELCPPGHADRAAALQNLASSLHSSFEMRASVDDLNEGISMGREALELCPRGHVERGSLLMNLAFSLSMRYEAGGERHVLEESISLGRESVAITPTGHRDRVYAVGALSMALRFRPEHLDEALLLGRESISLMPKTHYRRWEWLMRLATILHCHYEHSGVVEELEEAISVSEEALSLCPPNHILRPKLLRLQAKLAEAQSSSSPPP